MFGNTSFNNTSFGSATPFGGSVFGGTPSLGTPFGSTSQPASQPAGPVGTTIRFVPIQGTEPVQKPGTGTSSTVITRHQNISAMKEYESKSVDELRLEDYAANRKVGQPSPFQVGPFQTNSNSTSLFNSPSNQTNNAFGANNLFNSSQPKTGFNLNPTPGTSLFNTGATTSTTTTATNASPFTMGGFNTSTNNTSLFNNSANNTSSAFGTNNLFGNTQPKPNFSLGSTPGTGLFNTGAVTTTTASNTSPFAMGAFNNSANTTSLFNTPNNTSNAFGGGNIFNNTQPKTGFNMNPTPGTSLFNTGPATTTTTTATNASPFAMGGFNTSTNNTSLFSNTSNNQSNAFGNNSLFGNTQPKPNFSLGSTPGTSLFNTGAVTTTTASNTSPFAMGPFNTSATTTSLFNTPNNTSNAFGGGNIFNNTQPKTGFNLNPTPGTSLFNTGPATTTTATATNASPFTMGGFNTSTNNTSLFSNTSNNQSNAFGNNSLFGNTQPKPNFSLGPTPIMTQSQSPQSTSTDLISNRLKTLPYGESSLFLNDSSSSNNVPSFTTDLKTVNKYKMKAKTDIKLNKDAERTNAAMVLFDTEDDPSDDLRCAIEIFPPKRNIKKLDLTLNSDFLDERSGFISTRPDYKIDPSLEEIERCYDAKNDTCIVNSLLIDRPEYGSILFDSPLDVKGLNLDEIVFIRRKEVVVYPDDENKPPYGHGLNRPAIITLHQVWPIDKSTNQVIKDADRLNLMKYTEKIKSITAEKDARFIDYRSNTGTWVFAVKHFSKYGITDDDDVEFIPVQQQPQSQDSTISSQGMVDNSIVSDKSLAMSALFDEIGEDLIENQIVEKSTPKPLQLSVHKSKRLALHLREPSLTPIRTPLNTSIPTNVAYPTIMSSVPKQPKTRELKIVPDLYAACNRLPSDIMSVCVAGSPKVCFFNGSRKFCIIRGDKIVINELKLVPTLSNGSLEDKLKERLERFLENNSLITQMNMNPTLAPYIETYDYIPDASSHRLLHALYGNLSSKTPYAKQDERLNRVIDWLASVNRGLPEPEGLYPQIIYHMSCDRYDLASALAIDNNHPRLALLVATLNLNKDFMLEQLSSWRLSTADQYINPELFKIYILLAGLTEWKLSNDETIYCLKGLEWTQQMCLMILHVTAFDTESEKYGFLLLPSYIKRLDSDTDDVDYHILARHNPCEILSAAETLIDEWFLLESLKSFHVINSETESMNSDVIHCNLASQLAAIDLRWACFVALHIMNNEIRNQVLVKCLEQNHLQLKDGKKCSESVESWLIEKLNVPQEFIVSSKSVGNV